MHKLLKCFTTSLSHYTACYPMHYLNNIKSNTTKQCFTTPLPHCTSTLNYIVSKHNLSACFTSSLPIACYPTTMQLPHELNIRKYIVEIFYYSTTLQFFLQCIDLWSFHYPIWWWLEFSNCKTVIPNDQMSIVAIHFVVVTYFLYHPIT